MGGPSWRQHVAPSHPHEPLMVPCKRSQAYLIIGWNFGHNWHRFDGDMATWVTELPTRTFGPHWNVFRESPLWCSEEKKMVYERYWWREHTLEIPASNNIVVLSKHGTTVRSRTGTSRVHCRDLGDCANWCTERSMIARETSGYSEHLLGILPSNSHI
jgi:hypothetical protein